jgi:hypothetical protein
MSRKNAFIGAGCRVVVQHHIGLPALRVSDMLNRHRAQRVFIAALQLMSRNF